MSDDPKQRNAPDSQRINVHEEHELRYWTKTLGVTAEALREAVARVGSSAEKVREALKPAR